ncbi:hypothetical protein Q1695_013291 [Nippostrongylus brasiliensis]|nr:hypothetical protein Q1695_013291 [Nippostrongylus brasiliensis]
MSLRRALSPLHSDAACGEEKVFKRESPEPTFTNGRPVVNNRFSPITRQVITYRNRNCNPLQSSLSASHASYADDLPEDDIPLPRLVEETSTSRSACSIGNLPIAKSYLGGCYLLRIPKNEIDCKPQLSSVAQRRILIPTVPPSMSMRGECSADEYEVIYENDDGSPICMPESDVYEGGYYPEVDRKNFFCSEMTCFWHGPTQASLRRHMMVTHSRNVVSNNSRRTYNGQEIRRSSKPKGVKCSECDEMAYSRPLLLKHMTQVHGIVAPLIYRTFSDREKLQIWLEQLRETHAVEFVVSSGSKKWGQGLQVHYLTCSRSGEQKERPNKKFRRPTRPSIKCGKNCMAYLKMKQNPTVSELKIEACLHHSGHEIDASKIRLERNEWCRVIQLVREIEEGNLQIDVRHMTRIREILGNNGRFRLMTDEGLCRQLPKWIEQYTPEENVDLSTVHLEPELTIDDDPLLGGYETVGSLDSSLLLDSYQNYDLEGLSFDFMSDVEPTTKITVKG